MSDRVVIQCPSCDRKLGIKKSMLGVEVKCPGCGAFLAARSRAASDHQRSSDDPPSRSRRQRSSAASKPERSASSASRRSASSGSSVSKSSKSSSRAVEQNPSKKRSGRKSRNRRSRSAPVEDDFLDDDWGGSDDYGADEYSSDNDASGMEQYDDGHDDDWLDDGAAADWTAPPGAAMSSGRKKTKKKSADSAGSGRRKRKKKRRKANEPGSLLSWVGSGLLAGLISIGLTIAVGFINVWFLLIISGIFCAGLIGGSIRAAAGSRDGWAPGLVAVFILLPSLFVGRYTALYLNPDMIGLYQGYEPDSVEDSQARIDRETSEDAMIASIVVDEIYRDDDWQSQNGVTDDNFYADIDWEAVDEDELSQRELYNEKVWAEGVRRWEEIPEEGRRRRIDQRREQMRLEAGLLTEEEVDALVAEATTEEALTERVADDLEFDFEFLSEAGLKQEDVWEYSAEHSGEEDPEARVHPQVWAAAERQWTEMDEAEKAEWRQAAELGIRLNATDVEQVFFAIVVLGATLYSMLMPFLGLGCTVSAICLAFSTGSGLASG